LKFELGKVKTIAIREKMIARLAQIDVTLAKKVATALGLVVPKKTVDPGNKSIPADGNPADFQPIEVDPKLKVSEALSMANTIKGNIKTRKIAIIAADGVNEKSLNDVKKALLLAELQ
jgi:catalase